MKKLLSLLALTLALLCASSEAKAQYFSDPEWPEKYDASAVFYVDLIDANGQSITANFAEDTWTRYAIGAFINDEIRGAGYAMPVGQDKYVFQVRVWGDVSEDTYVVLRVQDNGIEYWLGGEMVNFAEEPTFGEPSKPLQFQFVPITGIAPRQNPIEVMVGEMTGFGWDYLPEGYTPPVTEMEKEYIYDSGTDYFDLHPESLWVAGLAKGEDEVIIRVRPQGANVPWETSVVIRVLTPDVSVEGIEAGDNGTDVTLYVGEGFNMDFKIVPEDASNKNVTYTIGNTAVVTNDGNTLTGVGKGTTTVTVTTEDGDFSLVYNVTVKQPVTNIQFNDLTIVRDTKVPITADMYTVEPADADFDINNLTFQYNERLTEGLAGVWVVDNNSALIGFTPYSDNIVSYEYEQGQAGYVGGEFTVKVLDKIHLDGGWNWMGLPYEIADANVVYEALDDNFVEARSKTQLIYNDPVYGNFGDLWALAAGEGYKVKVNGASDFTMEPTGDAYLWEETSLTTTKGWNWLGNKMPRATTIDEIVYEANDGDIVKTLDGMATYTEGDGWSSSLEIGEHQGFLYKSVAEGVAVTYNPNFCFDDEDYINARINGTSGPSGIKARSVWQYDAGLYPTTMGIIAEAPELADSERYTIGAFVEDECRGQGTLQKGRWYVVAHAKNGERVSLRLYDRRADRFADLDIEGAESIPFAEVAGSAKAPLHISAPYVDAISGVRAAATGKEVIYNLAGQRLNTLKKGVNIIDGRKVVVK